MARSALDVREKWSKSEGAGGKAIPERAGTAQSSHPQRGEGKEGKKLRHKLLCQQQHSLGPGT